MKEFSKRRTDAVKGLRRYRFLFPPKNKYCLVGLKRHPDNWQLVVLTLCRIYNCFHSTKNKCCSRETSEGRKKFYMKFFKYAAKEFPYVPVCQLSKGIYLFKQKFHFLIRLLKAIRRITDQDSFKGTGLK